MHTNDDEQRSPTMLSSKRIVAVQVAAAALKAAADTLMDAMKGVADDARTDDRPTAILLERFAAEAQESAKVALMHAGDFEPVPDTDDVESISRLALDFMRHAKDRATITADDVIERCGEIAGGLISEDAQSAVKMIHKAFREGVREGRVVEALEHEPAAGQTFTRV